MTTSIPFCARESSRPPQLWHAVRALVLSHAPVYAVILTLGATGCSTTKKRGRISSTGAVMNVRRDKHAQKIAVRRASADLTQLLTTRGVRFSLDHSAFGESLVFEQDEINVEIKQTEFTKIPNGWIATVYAQRPPELDTEMRKLIKRNVQGQAQDNELAEAMRLAKENALRELIDQYIPPRQKPFTTSGRITLASLRYALPESFEPPFRVTVSVSGKVYAEPLQSLPEGKAAAQVASAVSTHLQANNWSEAQQSVERFLKSYPKNFRYGLLLGGIYIQLGDADNAKQALKLSVKGHNWKETVDQFAALEQFLGADGRSSLERFMVSNGIIQPPAAKASSPKAPVKRRLKTPKKRQQQRRRGR